MDRHQLRLKIRQVSEKLTKISKFAHLCGGVDSWARYIREGLNMSTRQLSERSGLSESIIYQTERNEKFGQVTIKSLQRIANALECDLVYAFVPRKPIEKRLADRALDKARRVMHETALNMELENQGVSKAKLQEQLKQLAAELKYSKNLWNKW